MNTVSLGAIFFASLGSTAALFDDRSAKILYVSPKTHGWLLGASAFAWPLVLAGGLKIAYDLLLLAMFRQVRPPEEEEAPAASQR